MTGVAYHWVNPTDVERESALRAADHSSELCGLRSPFVLYFAPAGIALRSARWDREPFIDRSGLLGFTYNDLPGLALAVRVGRTKREIGRTTAHEVRHLAQSRDGGLQSREWLEWDARLFGDEIVAQLAAQDPGWWS